MRRINALVKGIPDEGASQRPLADKPPWTLHDEYAARHVEVTYNGLAAIYHLLAKVHFKGPHHVPDPLVLNHPTRDALKGENTTPRKSITAKVFEAMARIEGR